MSKGKLQKRIKEQLKQMSELPKVMQEDRFIIGKTDGFGYSLQWITEAKKEFPLQGKESEDGNVWVDGSQALNWFKKWLGE